MERITFSLRKDLAMKRSFCLPATLLVLTVLAAAPLQAGDAKDAKNATAYPVAILPFQERGADVKDQGAKVTDLLFANLAANPQVVLVDREDIKKLLEEHELNLSGLVNPDQATKVGHLTGAKILVTGSVLQVDTKLYLIAKVIGTETSRVVGASVKGNVRDDLGKLVDNLGDEIVKTVSKRADDLVAKPVSREDRVATLKKKLGDAKRPALLIEIPEHHVGQPTIDPAAQTEVTLFSTESGFKVIDAKEGNKKDADVLLQGEAFSELAVRHGNLISVKARLELKAIDRATGQVLAIDRETTVAVDLTEQIAAKNALQQAGAALAERLLVKIAGKEKNGKAGK
jgi:TolB-like protein/regulator of RNase E activity RraB